MEEFKDDEQIIKSIRKNTVKKSKLKEDDEDFRMLFANIFQDFQDFGDFTLEKAEFVIGHLAILLDGYSSIDASFLVEKQLMDIISRYLFELSSKNEISGTYDYEKYIPVAELLSSLLRMKLISQMNLLAFKILEHFQPLIEGKSLEVLKQKETMEIYLFQRKKQLQALAIFYEFFAEGDEILPKLCQKFFNFATKNILDFDVEDGQRNLYFVESYIMKLKEITPKHFELALFMAYTCLSSEKSELYANSIYVLKAAIYRNIHQAQIFFKHFTQKVFPLLLSVEEETVEACLRLIDQILNLQEVPYEEILPQIPVGYILQNLESFSDVVQVMASKCLFSIAMCHPMGCSILLESNLIPILLSLFESCSMLCKIAYFKIISAIVLTLPEEYFVKFYSCNIVNYIFDSIATMPRKDIEAVLIGIERMLVTLSGSPMLDQIMSVLQTTEMFDELDALSDLNDPVISLRVDSIFKNIPEYS